MNFEIEYSNFEFQRNGISQNLPARYGWPFGNVCPWQAQIMDEINSTTEKGAQKRGIDWTIIIVVPIVVVIIFAVIFIVVVVVVAFLAQLVE